MNPEVLVVALYLDGDCSDAAAVWHKFLVMVNGLAGITVLGAQRHDFPGGGFSGLVLLGESHAAIHTWPEHRRAWVELATCGDPAALEQFKAWAPQVME